MEGRNQSLRANVMKEILKKLFDVLVDIKPLIQLSTTKGDKDSSRTISPGYLPQVYCERIVYRQPNAFKGVEHKVTYNSGRNVI